MHYHLLHRLAEHVAHAEARALLASWRQLRLGVAREVVACKRQAVAGDFDEDVGFQHGQRHIVGDFAAGCSDVASFKAERRLLQL